MSDYSGGFIAFWSHWYGKVLLTVICLFLIGIVLIAVNKDLDIDLWGLKISHSKTVTVHDTLRSAVQVPAKPPENLANPSNKKSRPSPVTKPSSVQEKVAAKPDSVKVVPQPQVSAKNYAGVNNGGHVGDNYIGTVPPFTESWGKMFIEFIEKHRRDSSIVSRSLIINDYTNSDQNRFGADLFEFLKANNYRVSIRTNVYMQPPFSGVNVHFDKRESCFEVDMGNYTSN